MMKERLDAKETIYVAVMLFGLFFGAGNLIFPVFMGQLAGANVWKAAAGFLVTGVGLPLLGVAAQGISRCDGLMELSGKVGRRYSIFFTCALYLTIGPFFAIPRCATVPFAVGVSPLISGDAGPLPLAAFSLVFFLVVLFFSLRPGKILTWVGKVLTPIFLVFLGMLVVTALAWPIGAVNGAEPQPPYLSGSFFVGCLEGYNTMDALASLAFGIIVIDVIRGLGIREPSAVAANTIKAGLVSSLIMAVIYLAVAAVGAQSRGLYETCSNGGEVLALVAGHYFGKWGAVILAGTVTFACLKTAVGLITSCAETFSAMFPKGPAYRPWAVIFCSLSFLLANLGLNAIIAYAIPVLMFLYPLAITLILLGLFGGFFGHDRAVYSWVTSLTLAAALFDFMKTLPGNIISLFSLDGLIEAASASLPFFSVGLGWACPAAAGLVIGLIIRKVRNKTDECV